MKNYLRFLPIFIAIIFSAIVISNPTVQANQLRSVDYTFVVIETAITKEGVETSDENPEENRFYVSNVIAFPNDPQLKRKAREIADEYFVKTVVEPMKAKGFSVEYYDQDVQINNGAVYAPVSKAEVEEMHKKALEDDLQGRGSNIFTFTWQYGKEPKGLETASPKLFHRDPNEPVYGEN